jgi:hypothetical protein
MEHLGGRTMPSRRLTVTLGILTLAAMIIAAAPAPKWKDYEKGRKTMNDKKRAGVYFFEGEEEDDLTKAAEADVFADKAVQKKMKKVVPIKIGLTEELKLRREMKVPGGEGMIVVVDVQGLVIGEYRGDVDKESLVEALEKAVKVSETKGKVLDKLEKAYGAGEKALKKKNYTTALQAFHLCLRIQEEKGEEVPSDLYKKADLAIAEIRTVGNEILDKAQEMLDQKQYANARKMAKDVENRFPDEELQNRAKGIMEAVDAAMQEQYGGKGR